MGTSLERNSIPAREVKVDRPTILVLGNEGVGMRTNVARACDVQVRVEGGGIREEEREREGGALRSVPVDSLNVGVTGGLLMHLVLGGAQGEGEDGLSSVSSEKAGEEGAVDSVVGAEEEQGGEASGETGEGGAGVAMQEALESLEDLGSAERDGGTVGVRSGAGGEAAGRRGAEEG